MKMSSLDSLRIKLIKRLQSHQDKTMRKILISSCLVVGITLPVFNTVASSKPNEYSFEYPQAKETYEQMKMIQQNLNFFNENKDKVLIGTGWRANPREDFYQNIKKELSSQFGEGKVEILGLPSFGSKPGQESFTKNAIRIAGGLKEAIGDGRGIHYVPHSMQALDFSMLTILSEYKKNPNLINKEDKKIFNHYLMEINTELQKQGHSSDTFWKNFSEEILPALRNVILYDMAIGPPVDKRVLVQCKI